MSGHPNIDIEIRETAAIVTLNHAPANTWTLGMLSGLRNLVADLEARRSIRCLIVTGAGPKFFSGGADLELFRNATPQDAQASIELFVAAFDSLASFRGVTIAAINGYALGGGLECAIACDFRIAGKHARLGLPEARVGLLPGAGGTQRLPLLVGEAWAKRLILLGEMIDAPTACRIGLVNEVVPDGASVDTAMSWANKVNRMSPAAISACKRLIEGARELPLSRCFEHEREQFVSLFGQPEQKEGVAAFFEKREPAWHLA